MECTGTEHYQLPFLPLPASSYLFLPLPASFCLCLPVPVGMYKDGTLPTTFPVSPLPASSFLYLPLPTSSSEIQFYGQSDTQKDKQTHLTLPF